MSGLLGTSPASSAPRKVWGNPVRRARLAAARPPQMRRTQGYFPSAMLMEMDDERKRYPVPPSRSAMMRERCGEARAVRRSVRTKEERKPAGKRTRFIPYYFDMKK
jgi:hypothetical protein